MFPIVAGSADCHQVFFIAVRGIAIDVVDFEIHHIDGDPTNGDEENLVAVCRSCHYREHDRTPPTDLESWKEGFLDLG